MLFCDYFKGTIKKTLKDSFLTSITPLCVVQTWAFLAAHAIGLRFPGHAFAHVPLGPRTSRDTHTHTHPARLSHWTLPASSFSARDAERGLR